MTIDRLIEILMSDKPSVLIDVNKEEIFRMIPELKICDGFDQKYLAPF